MRYIVFILFVFFVVPVQAQGAFSDDITPQEQRMLDRAEANIETCRDEPEDYLIAMCFNVAGSYGNALYGLSLMNDGRFNVTPYKIVQTLKRHSLHYTPAFSHNMLDIFRRAGIDNPDFYVLADLSLVWGAQQRQMSAEDLYTLAQQGEPDPSAEGRLSTDLSDIYLRLAEEKGHEQARQDMEKITKNIDAQLLEEYPELQEKYDEIFD